MIDRRSLLKAAAALGAGLTALAKGAPAASAAVCPHDAGTLSWDSDYNYRCVLCDEVLYNERDLHQQECANVQVIDFYPGSNELDYSTMSSECVPYDAIDWNPVY